MTPKARPPLEKETKVSCADPEAGYRIRDGKPTGFSVSITDTFTIRPLSMTPTSIRHAWTGSAFKGAMAGHHRHNRQMFCHFKQDHRPPGERGLCLPGDGISFTPGWAEGGGADGAHRRRRRDRSNR